MNFAASSGSFTPNNLFRSQITTRSNHSMKPSRAQAKALLGCNHTRDGQQAAAFLGNLQPNIIFAGESRHLDRFHAGRSLLMGKNCTGTSRPFSYTSETLTVPFECSINKFSPLIPSSKKILASYSLLLTCRNMSGLLSLCPALFIFSAQLSLISHYSLILISSGTHQSLDSSFSKLMKKTGNQLFVLSDTDCPGIPAGWLMWITIPFSSLLLATQTSSSWPKSSKFPLFLQIMVAVYSPTSSHRACWTGLKTIVHSLRLCSSPRSIDHFLISCSSISAIMASEGWSVLYWLQVH